MKQKLTCEYLRTVLDYNAITGKFKWKRRNERGMKPGRCGWIDHSRGYMMIGICGMSIRAHRIAWMYVYGEMPNGQIDHINGNRLDNRIANLRVVDYCGNAQNVRKPRAHSKIGVLGVTRSRNKFKTEIRVNNKRIHIGVFDTAEAAGLAYLAKKRELHSTCSI